MPISFISDTNYYYNTAQRNLGLSVCTCGMEHRDDGYSWGPGRVPYYDICHVEKGKGAYILNGTTYTIQAGDTFVSYPGQEQQIVIPSGTEWEYRWIGFAGNEASNLLEKMGYSPLKPVQHTGGTEYFVNQHKQLCECCGDKLSDSIAMTGALYTLFSGLFRLLDCDRIAMPGLLQNALLYIQEHINESITVDALCQEIGVRRSWLYRCFMQNTGHSPLNYIQSQRILNSCYYLIHTRMSIGEIADTCGWHDPMYYCRVFRNIIGMSPTIYRKSYMSSNNTDQ